MSDAKPVLVGMNNPYNDDPHYALYPFPAGAAGSNVYRMLKEASVRKYGELCRMGEFKYVQGFDRRNVLSAREWTVRQARYQGRELARELCGRRVVVFGVQTLAAMGLAGSWSGGAGLPLGRVWLERRTGQSAVDHVEGRKPIEYWLAPHPSGRCREYNDPTMRERVGDLLLSLYEGTAP